MNPFSKIKENLFPIFQTTLIVLLIFLVGVFVVVLCFEDPKRIFKLLGVSGSENPKYEVLKFLGIGMGGILVALQALMSYKRAKAMEDTAKAQANAAIAQADAAQAQTRANENTEQRLRQERLKNAIEHLGHDSGSVRLGGAYELFHLAEDNKDLRKTAFDMLCLHIRQTTGEGEYQEKNKSKPSEEVQSLLTLLFVQDHKVFKGLQINLQGSYLNGADLMGARLEKAILAGVRLEGADLGGAHLQGAILSGAYLQGANLWGAHLQGAILRGAHLQGAILSGAYLQGADLRYAHLQGAGKVNWFSHMSFEDHIQRHISQETDLSDAIFVGGLSREDMDSLVKGLSNRKANELRERLEPHIDKPMSYGLPEDSGAITGAYTEKEAEEWIAEYEEAMSEVPKDDS